MPTQCALPNNPIKKTATRSDIETDTICEVEYDGNKTITHRRINLPAAPRLNL